MPETDLVDAARSAADDAYALGVLRRLIATPSVTGHEEAVATLVARELEGLVDGVEVDVFAAHRGNVYGRLGPRDDQAGVLFAGHLDVVPPEGFAAAWPDDPRADPFGATVLDSAVWGRGAADQKAGIAAVISALAQLRRAGLQPQRPVSLVFTADEESGLPDTGAGRLRATQNLRYLSDLLERVRRDG